MFKCRYFILILFVLIMVGCQLKENTPSLSPEGTSIVVPTSVLVTPTLQPTVVPSSTSAPPPPTLTNTPIPPLDLGISPNDIRLYPVPIIASGDQVTFQLLPHVPDIIQPNKVFVSIRINGEEIEYSTLNGRNLGGHAVGLFEWIWNTTDLVGEHQVEIILDPENSITIGDENPNNNQATLTIIVHEMTALVSDEANAIWVSTDTDCCLIHTVSGTAANRDIDHLITAVETAVAQASQRLEEQPNRKIQVYFIDKVIGQGGYAGSSLVVSYLDRNYTGGGLHHVLVHEVAHVLDRQFAPQRITSLAEGVAVWTSGGHYKAEDLNHRAAALVEIGRYIPLAELLNNFYPVQHEIGYSQVGGFVTYLVERDGWSQFRAFYSDVTLEDGVTPADAVDKKLQLYYNQTLSEIETEWLNYLQSLRPSSKDIADLSTTIRYYDIMRRYQMLYDPTAHFLTAWLPYPQAVREKGNPADLTRHPSYEINLALETMLHATDVALQNSNFNRANVLLDSVTRVLDNNGSFIDPLAINYLNIVRAGTALGYEIQQITLTGNTAVVLANKRGQMHLNTLNFSLSGQNWILTN